MRYGPVEGSPKIFIDGGVSVMSTTIQQLGERVETDSQLRKRDSLITRFLRWIYPDQRNAARHPVPPLVAFLGTARSSPQYGVGDISAAGFYMLTPERWLPGTEMPVTIQRTDSTGTDQTDAITVLSTVVRIGTDGVAFAFVLPKSEQVEYGDSLGTWATKKHLDRFLTCLKLSQPDQPLERVS
jgi:hypothetical protein